MNHTVTRIMLGALLLAAAYVSGSAAIHTGRWFFYFLTFGLIIYGLKLLIGSLRRGKA